MTKFTCFLIGVFLHSISLATATPTNSIALEQSLNSVSATQIQADIEFVASDEMGGRDTPSPGQRIAARFLVNRLQRLGLEPGFQDSYLYPFELPYRQIDRGACTLTATSGDTQENFEYGKDYFFSSRSIESLSVAADAVFVGDGSEKHESMTDRWLMIRGSTRSSWVTRNNATQMNAAAVVFLPDETVTEENFASDMQESVRRATLGRLAGRGSRDRQSLPMAYLSHEAANRLLAMVDAEKRTDDGAAVVFQDLGLRIEETRQCTAEDATAELENVVAFWPGSHPQLKNEVMIVSAHYDHVGMDANGEVYNGADDNGSGTVGLLALAEALTSYGPLQRSVLVIWVSGEEKGLLGSRAWVDNPWLPEGCKAVANINIDMIGRNAPERIGLTPTKEGPYGDEHSPLVELIERNAAMEGFTTLDNADLYFKRSDQANFAKLEIPVAFLFSDIHEDYHQTTDTSEKIDCDKIRRVVRLIFRVLYAYDTAPL